MARRTQQNAPTIAKRSNHWNSKRSLSNCGIQFHLSAISKMWTRGKQQLREEFRKRNFLLHSFGATELV
jgi:hypothetical protein